MIRTVHNPKSICRRTLAGGYRVLLHCFFAVTAALMALQANAQDQETPLQQALAVARQAIDDFPDHRKSHVLLGYVHQAASEWEAAIKAFEQSLAISPDQPDVLLLVARAYNKLYEYESAVEWYQKALDSGVLPRGGYQQLGLALVQLNRMDEARHAFLQEVTHFPDNASSHYYLAQRYFENDNLDEAQQHAERCMELDKRFPEPLYLLAAIARKQANPEAAKDYLQRFQQKKAQEGDYIATLDAQEKPSAGIDAQIHLLAGALYFQNHQDRQAEQHFRKTLEINPKNEDARVHLMQLYLALQNAQKLENVLRELLVLQPEKVDYLLKLGELLIAKKQWNEAASHLEKAFSLSRNTEIKRALSQALVLSQSDPQRGLQLMLEAVQEEPTARHYDLLSRAFYVNRDLPQSIEAMRMAMELDPQNPAYRQRYTKLKSLRP